MNWFREANDSSNFGKRKPRVACQLHVSIQSRSLVRAVRSLRTRVYGRIGLNARSSRVKGHSRIERGDVRSIATELTRHRLPSRFVFFYFLFTGMFYFRLCGIFRSVVTGRPEMSRVAVTR